MGRGAAWFVSIAALCAPVGPVAACDSTSCLLLTRGSAGFLGKGRFQLDVSFRHTDLSGKREGTESTDVVVRPKVFIEERRLVEGYHEDLDASESFLQLDLGWGAFAGTTVFASLPILGQKYYEVGHGGVQTSDNVRGLGDLVLGARHALHRSARQSLVASVGVKLPTGSDDVVDPYDGTVLDPSSQLGTGTGDVITALQWSTTAGGVQVAVSGSYQINTTSAFDYSFGNETIAAVTASRASGRVTPSLQVKLWNRPRSRFADDEVVPSTGGTIVYLNAGLRVQSPEGLGFYGFLLAPAYRDVNDAQLAPRFSLVLGFSKGF